MTVAITHPFVSAKGDSADPTLINPSNWNAAHSLTMATGKVLGRMAAGPGSAEELPILVDATGQSMTPPVGTTAQRPGTPTAGMTRYNSDTGRLEAYINSAWVTILTTVEAEPTGQISMFMLAAAPAGWLEAKAGTIGDASSGSSIRANTDTSALYAALWALDATVSPILTSVGAASTRGANAAADFAAHKRLTMPDMRGEFLRGLDNGRGVDISRLLGSTQADATDANGLTIALTSSGSSTFHGSALPTHQHDVNIGDHDAGGGMAADGSDLADTFKTSGVSAGTPSGTVSTTVTTTGTVGSGDSETRPRNVAWLVCVKL